MQRTFIAVRISKILFVIALLPFSTAWAYRDSCIRLWENLHTVKTDLAETLRETADWQEVAKELEAGAERGRYQPFTIRVKEKTGDAVYFTPAVTDLSQENVILSKTPRTPIQRGNQVFTFPTFGYDLPTDFRRIGPIEYLVVDVNHVIIEVGVSTPEVRNALLRHSGSVRLSPHELARISELNEKLLGDLRKNSKAQKKLREFTEKRGWPDGLAEEGQLAYFDPSVLNPETWASENGFTMEELVSAGWYHLDFDQFGKPRYRLNSPDSIKIPYLGADSRTIPLWRTRNLAKSNPKAPKYLSWQLDRSVSRRFTVSERLYNGWKLGKIKGKTVVITEGEFKCLVTEKLTGIPMFGIPGITEFDDEMVQALVEAEAEEYIVILDRDPHAKALLRSDEITDSNRAAYALAKDLERLGAKKVRVGILPEMANGEKLGIDDLALKYGPDPVRKTLVESLTSDDYAKTIGLDKEFQNLVHRQSKLGQAIKRRTIRNLRSGLLAEDPLIISAEAKLKKVNQIYKKYLENELNGASGLASASHRANSIRPALEVPGKGKAIRLRNGTRVRPELFTGDLLLLDYVPVDRSWKNCRPGFCGQAPFSTQELTAAFMGETPAGSLEAALARGTEIVREANFQPNTLAEFSLQALAGDLTHTFPFDEYRFEFGVQLVNALSGSKTTLPLMIFKRDSGRAVAIAELHLPGDLANEEHYWAEAMTRFDTRIEFLRGKPTAFK